MPDEVGEVRGGAPDVAGELRDLVEEQAAFARVVAVAAAAGPPDPTFRAVTDEAARLLGGALTALARYGRNGREQVVLAHTGDHVTDGEWISGYRANTLSARLWRSWRPERVDDLAALDGPYPRFDRRGVTACVGVPVLVDGVLWGCLSAASRTGPLPPGTEGRLSRFAEVVAQVVVTGAARLGRQALADEQAALLRVAALVARGAPQGAVFDAVALEASHLVDDEPTTLVRYEGRRTFTVLASRRGPAPPGTRYTVPVDDAGTSAEMLRTGRPARRDRYDDIAEHSFGRRSFGLGSSVSVPITVRGRLWGALGCLNEGRTLPLETEGRLVKFSELVASALAAAETRAELERFGAEQAALRRVAELAAGGAPHPEVLRAVVAEASALFDEAVVTVGRYTPPGGWQRVDSAGGRGGTLPGTPPPDLEETVAREVLAGGRPYGIEDTGPVTEAPAEDGATLLRACGVPVGVDGETWGCLLVTAGGPPLPGGTVDRLAPFAHAAGAAVAGDRSRDTLGRLAREQAALRKVAELIARGTALTEVFDAIATEASNFLGDAPVGVFRHDPDGRATLMARCGGSVPVGTRVTLDATTLRRPGEVVRFSTLEGTPYARLGREHGVRGMVTVPVVVEGRAWGRLATRTSDGAEPSAEAEERLFELAELVAAAVAHAESKAQLQASRARLVATADETRRRLQRDVHDGAQQRLVQTVLTLKLGLDVAARGGDPVPLMREALDHAERATAELRDLVHGILPAALSRGGLRSGLDSLIAGLSVPVDLDVDALPGDRLPAELEVPAYFVVAEALTNVVKHADATRARVRVALEADGAGDVLVLEVTDDGRGGADHRGTGLTGLADRVDALDGTLRLSSPAGAGTALRVVLPVPPPAR
ncbi:hypothetical protein GCM10022197_05180 [Microlunatus spumicola]|uniref:histidine kinase n=1 Tax=Microlunatus spumicola TaxID=81499 RepID=A0ABP6WMN4_9ACTN